LHDALPISPRISQRSWGAPAGVLPGSRRVWSRGLAARASGPLPLTRDAECGGALHFEGGSPIRQERGREWHRCGRSGMSAMEEMRNGIDDCPTLLALALPYAGHPDYRDEWKP